MMKMAFFLTEKVKRLWEQRTQHTVRGAFRPTIVPIENLQGNCVPGCVWENPTPAGTWTQDLEVWNTAPLQIFNGQDSWPVGTPDSHYRKKDWKSAHFLKRKQWMKQECFSSKNCLTCADCWWAQPRGRDTDEGPAGSPAEINPLIPKR